MLVSNLVLRETVKKIYFLKSYPGKTIIIVVFAGIYYNLIVVLNVFLLVYFG